MSSPDLSVFVQKTTLVHAPSEHCVGNHCHVHHMDELVTDDVYRVCFECKHVYYTAKDLEDAYARVVQQMAKTEPNIAEHVPLRKAAHDIDFCQYCLHDFLFEANE